MHAVGEQFANVQLGTIIATLVREMSWTLDQPFPGNDYTVSVTVATAIASLSTHSSHSLPYYCTDHDRDAFGAQERHVHQAREQVDVARRTLPPLTLSSRRRRGQHFKQLDTLPSLFDQFPAFFF